MDVVDFDISPIPMPPMAPARMPMIANIATLSRIEFLRLMREFSWKTVALENPNTFLRCKGVCAAAII